MAPLITDTTDYLGYGYAALLIAGGLLGAIRKGSLISLIAGGGSGVLAGYGAYLNSQDPTDVTLPLAVSSFLTAVMTFRLYKSQKLMPAGLLSVISLIMLSRYAILAA